MSILRNSFGDADEVLESLRANLVTHKDDDRINVLEKRMEGEMEGMFWVSVIGLGLILGGLALLKKVQLSESLIVAYMILSSVYSYPISV